MKNSVEDNPLYQIVRCLSDGYSIEFSRDKGNLVRVTISDKDRSNTRYIDSDVLVKAISGPSSIIASTIRFCRDQLK